MKKDEIKNVPPLLQQHTVVRSPLWEDVAHLYLGCEVIGTYNNNSGSRGYLTGITNGGTECEIQFILEDGFNVEEEPYFNQIKEVKPILRTIDSLTDDERRECDKQVHKYEHQLNSHITDWAYRIDWLLKKRVDLFGLIKSGYALNASKLNVVSER